MWRISLLWISLTTGSLFLYSQEYRIQTIFAPTGDCRNAPELVICSNGLIWPYSRDSVWWFDQNHAQCFRNGHPGNSEFWVRIVVEKTGKLSLTVASNDKNQLHNFTLYKSPGTDNFCDRVMKRAIVPLRSTMFNESNLNGITGLTDSLSPVNTGAEPDFDETRRKSMLPAVDVKAGDICFLVIHPKIAESKGFSVSVSMNGSIGKLQVLPVSELNKLRQERPSVPINLAYTEFCSQMEDILPVTPIPPKAREEKFGSIKSDLKMAGIVTDSSTGMPLVSTFSLTSGEWSEDLSKSDPLGEYELVLTGNNSYELNISAVGYQSKRIKVMKTQFTSAAQNLNVSLCPLKPGEKFVLNHIYFYAGTYAFTTESSESLEDLLHYMTGHPLLRIEISGHTNGRGKVKKKKSHAHLGPEWNFSGNEKKLSKLRADALKAYLVLNGISADRIETAGFGGEQMLYPKPANKRERDMNKRVEIKIL